MFQGTLLVAPKLVSPVSTLYPCPWKLVPRDASGGPKLVSPVSTLYPRAWKLISAGHESRRCRHHRARASLSPNGAAACSPGSAEPQRGHPGSRHPALLQESKPRAFFSPRAFQQRSPAPPPQVAAAFRKAIVGSFAVSPVSPLYPRPWKLGRGCPFKACDGVPRCVCKVQTTPGSMLNRWGLTQLQGQASASPAGLPSPLLRARTCIYIYVPIYTYTHTYTPPHTHIPPFRHSFHPGGYRVETTETCLVSHTPQKRGRHCCRPPWGL